MEYPSSVKHDPLEQLPPTAIHKLPSASLFDKMKDFFIGEKEDSG
ncbi:MAG: hypothetical protein NT106_10650 [Candidatus Sumerlaeota bacterium]|nr:hypothetical protein [Candidatus Sumerlaeota bacterium]